jgi:peptidoglycan hydrolase-like protein with peptidoglycan-binding domain
MIQERRRTVRVKQTADECREKRQAALAGLKKQASGSAIIKVENDLPLAQLLERVKKLARNGSSVNEIHTVLDALGYDH